MPDRRSLVLALVLAVAAAALVGFLVRDTTDLWRAEASLPIDPVLDDTAIERALRLGKGPSRSPHYDEEAPELPGGLAELDRVVARAAAGVEGADAALLRDELRLIDTGLTFLERPTRLLLVRAVQSEEKQAVAAAGAVAREYQRTRRRALEESLGRVERELRVEAAEGNTAARRERAAELLDGTRITRRLAAGSLGRVRPPGPARKLASSPRRDVVVAAIVGALLGLVLPFLARGRRRLTLAAAALAAAALLSACGDSDGEGEPAPPRPPLPYGQPEDAAVRYLTRVGDGDLGYALGVLHPSVVRALGTEQLASALAFGRTRMAGAALRVLDVKQIGPRAPRPFAVKIRSTRPNGTQERIDAVVTREKDRWHVAVDEVTRDSLGAEAYLAYAREYGVSFDDPRARAHGRVAALRLAVAGAEAAGLEGREDLVP